MTVVDASRSVVSRRTRGLRVRKADASNAVVQPPAKLQKLEVAPLATPIEPAVLVRPKNAPISKECEMLTEDYVDCINGYLFDAEEAHHISEHFLSKKKVTPKMRSILVDWIVQVHDRFGLEPETLHLTVYIVDRYLERVNVDKTELQLMGVCAMLLACKYDDSCCPLILDFEYIADHAFSKKEILHMETRMVKSIGFSFGRPHSIQFLHSFCKRTEATPAIHCLALYLAEMCLLDASFSSIKASLIAGGSLWLADHIKGSDLNLQKAFASVTDVDFRSEVEKAGKMIARSVMGVRRVDKLKAVTDKYAKSKMRKTSSLNEEEVALLEKMGV